MKSIAVRPISKQKSRLLCVLDARHNNPIPSPHTTPTTVPVLASSLHPFMLSTTWRTKTNHG